MDVLVSVIWTLTALGGLALAGTWQRAVRRHRTTPDLDGREPGAITSGALAPHATLVVGGLLLWIVASFARDGEPVGAVRLIAAALLVVGMGLGLAMARRWVAARQEVGPDAAVPAVGVVAHGLLAVATLVVAVAVLATR